VSNQAFASVLATGHHLLLCHADVKQCNGKTLSLYGEAYIVSPLGLILPSPCGACTKGYLFGNAHVVLVPACKVPLTCRRSNFEPQHIIIKMKIKIKMIITLSNG